MIRTPRRTLSTNDGMPHLIPNSEVARYSAGPSVTTTSSIAAFQTAIRAALGDDYETFLEGSYKNDTAIRDINDVDIVAIRRTTVSTVFSEERFPTSVTWDAIFSEAQARLGSAPRFRGKVTRGDKCLNVDEAWHADVIPAVRILRYDQDPIAVYSFREASERKNWPRVHYDNGVAKHRTTNQSFKPIVRMFKAWVANQWPQQSPAPSFYVECLISNVPDDRFGQDLASAFFSVGYWIEQNIRADVPPVVWSVARDKDILVANEWHPDKYAVFLQQVTISTSYAAGALQATTVAEATRLWRRAFNEWGFREWCGWNHAPDHAQAG
ncbi:MAG: nucleotidyltransferase [Candidatus Eisenbacteria bacterium]|nr:nucleotidyltransferase [Candidatus Eisenbacteria bacterium]